jgi:PAS domain S-box-containing protein
MYTLKFLAVNSQGSHVRYVFGFALTVVGFVVAWIFRPVFQSASSSFLSCMLVIVGWYAGVGPSVGSIIIVSAAIVFKPDALDHQPAKIIPQFALFLLTGLLIRVGSQSRLPRNVAPHLLSVEPRDEAYNAMLRAVADHVRERITICDVEGNTVFVSPAAKLSKTKSSQRLFAIAHPDDRVACDSWWMRIVNGSDERLHWRVKGDAADWRWLETSAACFQIGGKSHVATICRDISDRKRVEEELRQSEEKARRILDAIPHQIWSGTADGTLDYCNEQWRNYSGISLADAQGNGWEKIIHPEEKDKARRAWSNSVQTGKPYEVEKRHRRADGAYRWFLCRAVPQRNGAGEIKRWYGTNTDIQDRKEAQERLDQLQLDLRRGTRVTLGDELTASITHEVNQPLAAVVTNAEALLRWLGGNAPNFNEAVAAAHRIVRDAARASAIVKHIRDFVKRSEFSRTSLDLNDLVRDTLALVQPQLQRSEVEIALDMAADVPPISANRIQLQQVLMNLILNSEESLRTTSGTKRCLKVSTARENNLVHITVADNGPGIKEEDTPNLFRPFFTTKEDGLGLGLPISRSIIENHGGTIWADSRSLGGAQFHILLPAEFAEKQ